MFAYARLTLEDSDVVLKDPTDPQRLGGPLSRARRIGPPPPGLPYEQIPAFMRELRAIDTPDARLLELTILTGNRAGAVRLMRFDQIDLKDRVWRVPRPQLKTARFLSGEYFRVPLPARASKSSRTCACAPPLVFPDSHDMTTINLVRKLCRAGSWTDPASGPGHLDPWLSHVVQGLGSENQTRSSRDRIEPWARLFRQDRGAVPA